MQPVLNQPINTWAYQKDLQPYLSVLHRKIISLVVLILRRLYTSKNYKNTKIHHFERQTDHSRNQPTVLTITIQTNYTLLYRPIYFLYTLTHPTSLTSNVLLIRLFAVFRIFLKTARRLSLSLRSRQKLISFLKFCLRNTRSQTYCILLFDAKWFTNRPCD